MPQQERQTAKLLSLEQLNSGKYFQREGFEPNFLLLPSGKRISRGRVVATVVDRYQNDDGTYGALTLDDGTDTAQAKFFSELGLMEGHEVGDEVEIIGKVREYQGEIYIGAELVNNVEPEKELLHSLRLAKTREQWDKIRETVEQLKESGKNREEIEKEMAGTLNENEVDALLQSFNEKFDEEKTEEDMENLEKDVLEAVKELDDGDGADYSDIIEEVEGSEEQLEDTINSLLSEGTCYEPQPGRIKKL